MVIFEIRLHGIGGQGVAASADLLALAAVRAGMWAHSFPFFGTEIRGGNVTAFTRISPDPFGTGLSSTIPFDRGFSAISFLKTPGMRARESVLSQHFRSIKDLPTPPQRQMIVWMLIELR